MSDKNSCCSCKCGLAARTVLLGFILFLVGGIGALFLKQGVGTTDTYEAQRAAKRIKTRLEIEAQAKELLTASAWVDQAKGVVRIPLEDAMALEIQALKQKTPHPAYAVGASVPIPASATAPAAPAAPATATASTPATQPAPKK